jgi:hypothetical protein
LLKRISSLYRKEEVMATKHSGISDGRVRLRPRYFEDAREYEFVVHTGPKETVVVALFHDPGGLMDEVFGFTLTAREAADMGRALLEVADFEPAKD